MLTLKRAVFAVLACLSLCAVGAQVKISLAKNPYEIGEDFEKAETWKQTGAAFVKAHRLNDFRFLEEGKTDAANATREGRVKFYGYDVYETRIWFNDAGVSRIELSLYNKGDAAKPLASADLVSMLKSVSAKLTSEGARAPSPETTNVGGGVLQKQITWKAREPAAAQLTWRYKKVAGGAATDFVRVTLVNAAGGAAAVKDALVAKKASQGRGSIKKNVVKVMSDSEGRAKAKAGDVFIDNVPMVDQGQKGYCAVATSERVLRYYGQNVDEHEIGSAAGSTASQGTDVSAMYATVNKIGRKYGLSIYSVVGGFNRGMEGLVQAFMKEIADYNKMAKKMKKHEIALQRYLHGGALDANAIRQAMETDVLKAARLKSPKFKIFQKALHDQITAGVPLFWGVTLGFIPEPDIPQADGGHMRLIIGYNDKTKELVYTDTWGAGHEFKRMLVEDAFAITDAVFYLKPNRE